MLSIQTGCAYRIGAELAAGVFDESTGERKSDGMDSITRPLVEKAIVKERRQNFKLSSCSLTRLLINFS